MTAWLDSCLLATANIRKQGQSFLGRLATVEQVISTRAIQWPLTGQ